jgi:acetyl esterase/lipase
VLSPPPDHRKGTREHYYAPNELLCDPYVSPYWGSFHDLPALFIQGGTAERLYDEIQALFEKAVAQSGSGVMFHRYMQHVHVFPFFFPIDGACADALRRGGVWIDEVLGDDESESELCTFDFQGVPLSKQVYRNGKPIFLRILQ